MTRTAPHMENPMSKIVTGLSIDAANARSLVETLRRAGFGDEQLSVLHSDRSPRRLADASSRAPEGAVVGATAGASLGGTFGWLVGVGSLALPDFEALAGAGPILASLTGAAVGAAVGGLAGALVGIGVPAFDARRYERALRSGAVLLSVRVANARDAERARSILARGGAEAIALTRETPGVAATAPIVLRPQGAS